MGYKILIIEDDDITSRLYETVLENVGFQTILAENGTEAFKKLAVQQPDLILLDMRMPLFSGLSFCRLLRKSVPSEELPIIMVSAQSDWKLVQNAMQAGVDKFVAKPISPKTLVKHVHTLLSS